MKRKLIGYLFIFCMLFLTACQKDEKTEKENINVTLRLQWMLQSQFAGYIVAKDKGYYEAEGLNVNIEEGGYGKDCITTVKEGAEEFGISKLINFANENNLISIAQIMKDSGLIYISKKEKNINSPKDLIGKKVGLWFVGNEVPFYAYLDKNKISKADMKMVRQDWDMKQFEEDKIDIASAMRFNELILLFEKGKYNVDDINIIDLKKEGINFPGESIFTNKEYYRKNPEICRKFVRASLKGWRYAIENPNKAVDIVMKYDKEKRLNTSHEKKQILEIMKLINSDKYKLGYHYDDEIINTINTYKQYEIVNKKVDAKSLYTNEFIDK